jgi:hypothetical protein
MSRAGHRLFPLGSLVFMPLLLGSAFLAMAALLRDLRAAMTNQSAASRRRPVSKY